ncbi:MAG: hypothetical protein COV66_11845 [Nitrospinae bacterium CG11_big_fil_rev_8_21_14_0_20_45_15]|nr:MAG: hypothetical protein COV66_11845 [Nitrospinae bacterium CG11_big_fil_rev_8_21_14_0_20_45_15]
MKKVFYLSLSIFILLTTLVEASQASSFPSAEISQWNTEKIREIGDPDYAEVRQLVSQGEYKAALDLLDTKIKHLPREATPVYLKAMVLFEMGQYRETADLVSKAYKMEQFHPITQYLFCLLNREMGQAETAKRSCLIATQQHSSSPQTFYEYSVILEAMGEMPEANKQLQKAEELDPRNPLYAFRQGMNLSYLNQPEEAEKKFQHALEIDENHVESMYQLAYMYAVNGKNKEAKELIARMLQSNKEFSQKESALNLRDYIDKGETARLPQTIKPAQYHTSRSRSLYEAKKYGLALIEIETAARLQPKDTKILQILIGVNTLLLRLTETEEAIQRLLELNPDNNAIKSQSYLELADIQVLRGNLDSARNLYFQASKLTDPQGIAKVSLKEFPKENIPTFPNPVANETFIDPTEALNRKGEVFAYYGMFQRALANYALAIRFTPGHLFSMLNTATAYQKNGQTNKSISILEGMLVSHPNHPYMSLHRLLLAKGYFDSGNTSKGLANIKEAIKLNPAIKSLIDTDPDYQKIKDNETFKKEYP